MITEQRKQVLRACLCGVTPEEKQFVRDYCARIFTPGMFSPKAPKADPSHDYEGAILARQSASEF